MSIMSFFLSAFVILACLNAFAQTRFNPTTTLTAETANNTSAADTFASSSNGNIGAGNVSKVPTRTLLYPGSTAKLYAHLLPWFGFGNHIDVGYNSADVLQVQKQVSDMISRGLDGVIIDWHGRGATSATYRAYDQGTQAMMHESEQHPGFSFAIMADVAALKDCFSTSGCDLTETLIEDLNYAFRTYEGSASYMRYGKRPVVFFFGHEAYPINWGRVRAKVAGDPVFIFRNSGSFKHESGGGAYSWLSPLQGRQDDHSQTRHDDRSQTQLDDPMSLGYLDNYYRNALSNKDEYSLGAGYKGFDDSVALWGSNRFIHQQCGQTWLQSIAEANKYYSLPNQMPGIQLVTWNDYEEGTEFESGIDNCVNVSIAARRSSIFWKLEGDTSTIDHYTIFVSRDGENLMPLADMPNDARSLDLARFGLDAGEYTAYVKAVAKPSMANKMSEGVRFNVASWTPGSGPTIALNVSGNAGFVPATIAFTVSSLNGDQLPASTVIDFGDGTIVTGLNSAEHVYRLPGEYAVLATITNSSGLSSTQTIVITIQNPGNK